MTGKAEICEVIAVGKLEHFQSLLESTPKPGGVSLVLHGPIRHSSSFRWLVPNGFNGTLDAIRKGRAVCMSTGPCSINLPAGSILDDLAAVASTQGIDLLPLLRVGQIQASELPNGRFRVLFSAGGFQAPDAFWLWVKGLIEEMKRLGFLREVEQQRLESAIPGGLADRGPIMARPDRQSGRVTIGTISGGIHDSVIVGGDVAVGSPLPSTEPSVPRPQPADGYDIAAIRQLLLAAFTPQTLRRFCQDRPIFRPIIDEFGPGHGLSDMVDRVVDYCQMHLLFDKLLIEI